MSKKTKISTEEKQAARRKREEEARKAAAAARKKKLICRIAGIGGAAAILLLGGGYAFLNTGTRALHHKVIASSEHYEVTAAMFACYFRQCADSYLKYAEQNTNLSVYDPDVSLKEQEYSNGETWYDRFIDNTMSTVKHNLQLAEAAYAEGYTLPESEEAEVVRIASEADLSRYQKGVRRSDLEKATRLTILADDYEAEAKGRIDVSDEEISSYYQTHQEDYLTASVLAYSFPWEPADIINGDYAGHDDAVEHAEELGKCSSQQDFSDYVFRYLTDEKEMSREDAEQMAAGLIITKMIRDYPDEVQNWINGGAKPGETFVWPREDQCYASVYMLREEPAADDSKTVDFREIYLNAAEFDGIEEAVSFAEELRDEVLAEEDMSEAFAERAREYSQDSQNYANGGLVAGYSATRTTYGDEIAAWAFDRERKHGDMTIVSRPAAAILAFFESANEDKGWENSVRSDLMQSKQNEFSQSCTQYEVRTKEQNYKYIKD